MAEEKVEINLEDFATDGVMPSRKQLLDMLEGSDLDAEMKEQLKNHLRGGTPELLGSTSTILAVMFVMLLFTTICKSGYCKLISFKLVLKLVR